MTWIANAYDTTRSKFGSLNVRHKGKSYTCPASSTTATLDPQGYALFESAKGAIRLKVSELKKPYPVNGDDIDVQNVTDTNYETYTCVDVSAQNNGETLRINYGLKYGS
tara:strand:- start:1869 stop:2195 length:327 start_codon:yes stop_codon:yes gene_type:complete